MTMKVARRSALVVTVAMAGVGWSRPAGSVDPGASPEAPVQQRANVANDGAKPREDENDRRDALEQKRAAAKREAERRAKEKEEAAKGAAAQKRPEGTKPRPVDGGHADLLRELSTLEKLPQPSAKSRWDPPIAIGRVEGQVAVRGPLVVAASAKAPAVKGEQLDGVLVIDGRGKGRVVRRFRFPGRPTGGVSLDGDDFVFSSSDGVVRKVRLDGQVRWAVKVGPDDPGTPSLVDINRDGIRDVVAPTPGAASVTLAVALDGRDGTVLWRAARPAVLRGASSRRLAVGTDANEGHSWVRLVVEADDLRQRVGWLDAQTGEWVLAPDAFPPVVPLPDRSVLDPASGYASSKVVLATKPPLALWSDGRLSYGPLGGNGVGVRGLDETGTSEPSLGDLDGDGIWDLVIATGKVLNAFSTGLSANVAIPLPHGDLQATGLIPSRQESPASYARHLPPGDERWLRPTSEGVDLAFERTPGVVAQDLFGPEVALGLDDTVRKSLRGVPPQDIVIVGSRAAAVVDGQPVICPLKGSACTPVPVPDGRSTHVAIPPAGDALWTIPDAGVILRRPPSEKGSWTVVAPSDPGAGTAGRVVALTVLDDAVVVAREQRLVTHSWNGEELRAAAEAPFRAEKVLRCGDRWFANNEGILLAPTGEDLRRWQTVPAYPGPVRTLGCSKEGALVVTTADGVLYTLGRPAGAHLVLWILAALMVVALLVSALLPMRSPDGRDESQRSVRRRFSPDVPFESRYQGQEAQRQLVDGLVAFIDNRDTRPPVTLAICGQWGSGKSSIMGAVRSELGATGRYIHVWFNAWRFQREAQIAQAFYQTILDEFRRQAGWMLRLRVLVRRLAKTEARDVLKLAVPAVLILGVLGVFALLLVGALRHHNNNEGLATAVPLVLWIGALLAGAWQKVLNPIRKVINIEPAKVLDQLKGRVTFVRDVKTEFESVFRALGDTTRLIVFVDDLDRCPPDRVADMLEALNMLSDTRQAFVVLAIDPVAVQRSVEVRFKELLTHMREQGSIEEARDFGARYVEKMVTVSVNVPRVTAAEVHASEKAKPPEPPRVGWGDRLLARAPLAITVGAFAALVVPVGMALRDPPSITAAGARLYTWVSEFAQNAEELEKKSADAVKRDKDTQAAGMGETKGEATVTGAGVAPSPAPAVQAKNVAQARGQSPHEQPGKFAGNPPSSDPFASQQPPDVPGPPAPRSPTIESVGSLSPSAVRLRAERWRLVLDGAALALALGALAVTASFVARRRRLMAAKPRAEDSTDFKAALERISSSLEANPRTTIRFTNLSRFLYHLVRQKVEGDAAWEDRFFAQVRRRWSKNAEAPQGEGPGWVDVALDVWLPRTGATPLSQDRPLVPPAAEAPQGPAPDGPRP
jgi:hypothetical protein